MFTKLHFKYKFNNLEEIGYFIFEYSIFGVIRSWAGWVGSVFCLRSADLVECGCHRKCTHGHLWFCYRSL